MTSSLNYQAQALPLATIMLVLHGSYQSDQLMQDFFLIAFSPFPFHGFTP